MSLKLRLLLTLVLVMVGTTVLITCFSVRNSRKTGVELARSQALPVCEEAVNYIDGDRFEALVESLDPEDPFYIQGCKDLNSIKRSSGCRYLYTMAKKGDTLLYVIDGTYSLEEAEGNDDASVLGEEEDISDWGEEVLVPFKTGEFAITNIEFQDEWGYTVSAYYPIKNSSGKVVGIVACDLDMKIINKSINNDVNTTIIIGILTLILGCFAMMIVTGRIFNKFDVVRKSIDNLADESADLTKSLTVKGNTESDRIAASVNALVSKLRNLISDLQGESRKLADSSDAMSDNIEKHLEKIEDTAQEINDISSSVDNETQMVEMISAGIEGVDVEIKVVEEKIQHQSGAIQESNVAVDHISRNIENVTVNVDQVLSKYQQLVSDAKLGRESLDKVSGQIEEIARESENLNEANAAIAAIAEQTNLLAMNAAIEAAHAGDAGKGFGVVADEIRALAETSGTQTGEIKALLEGISRAIEQIVKSAEETNLAFDNVSAKIVEMDGLMKNVQEGIVEENAGLESIVSTMKTIDSLKKELNEASDHMRNESANVFGAVGELKNIAADTDRKTKSIVVTMDAIASNAKDAVDASNQNREISDSVCRLLMGYKV